MKTWRGVHKSIQDISRWVSHCRHYSITSSPTALTKMSWVGFLMVLCITVSFVSDPMAAMFFGQRPSGKRMMLKDRLQNRREKEVRCLYWVNWWDIIEMEIYLSSFLTFAKIWISPKDRMPKDFANFRV